MASKHFVLEREGGLYAANSNYFDFLKLISTNTPLTLSSKSNSFNSLEGMSSLTYTKFPPPLMSRSIRKGTLYPGMTNNPCGNVASIFVS